METASPSSRGELSNMRSLPGESRRRHAAVPSPARFAFITTTYSRAGWSASSSRKAAQAAAYALLPPGGERSCRYISHLQAGRPSPLRRIFAPAANRIHEVRYDENLSGKLRIRQ